MAPWSDSGGFFIYLILVDPAENRLSRHFACFKIR